MADEIKTDETKTEAKTYDQPYVTRLTNEAARERLEKEAIAKERDELKAFREERERKDLEAKGEYEKASAKIESDRKAEAKKFADELAVRDKRVILAEAKAVATKLGIIDASDVATADLADLRIAEDGSVAGVEAKIIALKAAKPHWFAPEKLDEQGRPRSGASPSSAGNGTADVDWGKLTDAQVEERLATLLRP